MAGARIPPVGTSRVVGGRLPFDRAPLEAGGLFVSEDGAIAELPRPFERRHRGVVPDAVQIRIAPRGSRRSPSRQSSARGLPETVYRCHTADGKHETEPTGERPPFVLHECA